MPHEEVRDYFYQRQNYLHELDTSAEELTSGMRIQRGDLVGDLADRLRIVHGVRIIRRIDLGQGVLHRYDPTSKTLEIGAHLSSGQTVFRMAAELAYLECGDLIDKLVEEGHFTSAESQKLARLGLANYFAAATVLPYGQFHEVAEKFRYDVERLSAYYSSATRPSATGSRRCSGRRCGAFRSHSFASTARATCQNASPPPAFISPPAAERARCGMSTRRSPTRARSSCSSPRCPTAAATCGWRAPSSDAHRAMVRPVRRSRSASVANCAMHIGWCTRRDSI